MHTITLSKDFPVPAERLYQAWTSPEELKQWWRPMGNQLTNVVNDLNEGGEVRYTFNTGHGSDSIDIHGTYETVEPAKQLVYSWIWELPGQHVGNGDYKLHIGFEGSGEGSKLTVQQENFGSEEAVKPHQEGWEKALEDLHQYLSNKQ